jgi:Leucine-rich repeat (LRR) protein
MLEIAEKRKKKIDCNRKKTEKLWLNNKQLESLSPDLFLSLSSSSPANLTELWLNGNRLVSLEPSTFDELKNLKKLSLAGNKLSSIDAQLFQHQKKLTKLSLSNNELVSLGGEDGGPFRHLTNLKELWLNDNRLDKLERDVFANLKSLLKLYLHGNRLAKIEANTFATLSKLQRLDLDNNQLRAIDSDMFNGLGSLSELCLSCNQLTTLGGGGGGSQTFRNLGKLSELNVSQNQLGCVEPASFEGLNRLGKLYLHGNKLTSVDERAFHAFKSSIKVISLFGNKRKFSSFVVEKERRLLNFENDLISSPCLTDFEAFLRHIGLCNMILEFTASKSKSSVFISCYFLFRNQTQKETTKSLLYTLIKGCHQQTICGRVLFLFLLLLYTFFIVVGIKFLLEFVYKIVNKWLFLNISFSKSEF